MTTVEDTTKRPKHPGAVFREDVIKPLELQVKVVAKLLKVSTTYLNRLMYEKADLSPEMAIRLAKFTNTSIDFWYQMQVNLDIWKALQNNIEVEPYYFYLIEKCKEKIEVDKTVKNMVEKEISNH
jgi:addiction module HigA family antidote